MSAEDSRVEQYGECGAEEDVATQSCGWMGSPACLTGNRCVLCEDEGLSDKHYWRTSVRRHHARRGCPAAHPSARGGRSPRSTRSSITHPPGRPGPGHQRAVAETLYYTPPTPARRPPGQGAHHSPDRCPQVTGPFRVTPPSSPPARARAWIPSLLSFITPCDRSFSTSAVRAVLSALLLMEA